VEVDEAPRLARRPAGVLGGVAQILVALGSMMTKQVSVNILTKMKLW